MSLEHSIRSLSELSNSADSLLPQIRKIFFETTSRKKFKDEKARDDFFKAWTEFYITRYPNEFLIAFSKQNETIKVLGYLSGCSDSVSAEAELAKGIKSYPLFNDLFDKYPAHFHINFSSESQGLGLGTLIVDHYKKLLTEAKVAGVHIITAADARNVSFYFRNQFTDQHEREYMGSRLKFMGCSLL